MNELISENNLDKIKEFFEKTITEIITDTTAIIVTTNIIASPVIKTEIELDGDIRVNYYSGFEKLTSDMFENHQMMVREVFKNRAELIRLLIKFLELGNIATLL